jgi:hypothetical protein
MQGRENTALTAEERKRCEDYFLSIAVKGYARRGDPQKSPIPRADLRALADELGGGTDAYFKAFCELQAAKRGKVRWGEKTPRHVYFIPQMLECCPGAQVVYMVRDPRAVVLSYRARGEREVQAEDEETYQREKQLVERWEKSFHILNITFLWRNSVRAALEARQQFGDGKVYLLRYEDLVTNPEEAIQSLANWLGMDFHPAMCEITSTNSSFAKDRKTEAGISSEPMQRWRQGLRPAEIAVIQSCCRSTLTEAGYEMIPASASPLQRAMPWVTLPFAAMRASLVNRARIGNIFKFIGRQLKLMRK